MKDDKVFTMALTAIIGGGAALWICYMIGIALGVTRSEAPAWVQAVGSILAIGVAIYVSKDEAKRSRDLVQTEADNARELAKEIDRENLKNSLRAMAAEIRTYASDVENLSKHYQRSVALGNVVIFPHTEASFPVFESCAGALGNVDDDSLRHNIVSAYGNIRRFYEAINRNTDAGRAYEPGDAQQNAATEELEAFVKAIPKLAESVIKCDKFVHKKLGIERK